MDIGFNHCTVNPDFSPLLNTFAVCISDKDFIHPFPGPGRDGLDSPLCKADFLNGLPIPILQNQL